MFNFKYRRDFFTLFVLFFLISHCVGCDNMPFLSSKKQAPAKVAKELSMQTVQGPIVAKVNNFPITLEDLNEEIDVYNMSIPEDQPELRITTREQKIEYLRNEMARRYLLYQEALDRRLDAKEEIRRALEKTKQDLLVIELIKQEAEKIQVTHQEIEDYYNSAKDQIKDPEERRIREIVVSTESEARDILILLLQGADFATLARDRSKAMSASNGGDLGYKESGKFPEFDAVAFADNLQLGKESSIFKGPDGYYIVKLEAKRGGKQKTLLEVWDDIKNGLTFLKQQQRVEELISELDNNAKIEVYEGEIQ